MDNVLQAIKDIVLIAVPIITAYITYRTNKKSKKELNAELEVRLKEQDNETANEIKKMQKQLEVQNMQSSWENSTPTTQKYIDEAGIKRYGNVSSLTPLVSQIYQEFQNKNLDVEDLKTLKKMLLSIQLPAEDEELYPYEIPKLMEYKKLLRYIDKLIANLEANN
ncbi:MAG TPA: hypothetical protein IAB51_11285 [Candidatus Merdivicinus excrementipullorum]|uniref:Uncharacterized protein n=1 Tax=Candidatus Merdivicinus excrementipullorum TaxID=2840867 RepID=A0A9D1FPL4_9FIRM|nr:hypothetical protein [Candidatus Merdivicinus excrementipullorum]HIZ54812.1 hypothetical protein [Bacillota bacterium]